LAHFSTLKKEATHFSKTSINFHLTTQRYSSKARALHNLMRENINSCRLVSSL
jgi:hypothetical protein